MTLTKKPSWAKNLYKNVFVLLIIIENFSIIARPLHDLTKKGAKYQLNPGQEEAFQELKKCHMTKLPLRFQDLKKPFEVHCDTCGDSLGALLLKEG